MATSLRQARPDPSRPDRAPAGSATDPAEGGDGRRERWRSHRAHRRAELIAAVATAVTRVGPRLSMDDIARATGVSKPVFYRYFSDKADLFRAVGSAVAERVVTEVTAAVDGEAAPRAQLRAGIDAFLARVEASPDIYRFVLDNLGHASSRSDPVRDYASVMGVEASRVIGDGLRAAGRDSGMAEAWGFAVVGAVRSAAERWIEHPVLPRQVLADQLADLLWHGLGGPGHTAGSQPAHRTP